MKLSNYFLPVLKESPSEAEIVSHKLMLRSGKILKCFLKLDLIQTLFNIPLISVLEAL